MNKIIKKSFLFLFLALFSVLIMGCKKKRNYYLAQKYRGQCEILLELLMNNNYKFSDDPHDLYNIILTDIRGF